VSVWEHTGKLLSYIDITMDGTHHGKPQAKTIVNTEKKGPGRSVIFSEKSIFRIYYEKYSFSRFRKQVPWPGVNCKSSSLDNVRTQDRELKLLHLV